jgi:DNA-directed RNA polymerase subunit RPC12/RpoP
MIWVCSQCKKILDNLKGTNEDKKPIGYCSRCNNVVVAKPILKDRL